MTESASPPLKRKKIDIVAMSDDLMPQVMNIEQACFKVSAWPQEEFASFLADEKNIAKVARSPRKWGQGKDEPEVYGYILHTPFGMDGEATIHNFAVHPDHQRQDIGEQLIENVLDLAVRIHSQGPIGDKLTIKMIVDERNEPAQAFLAHCGFKAKATATGYEFTRTLKFRDVLYAEDVLEDMHANRCMMMADRLNLLKKLTGQEFEFCERDKRAKLWHPLSVSEAEEGYDPTDLTVPPLFLRSKNAVENPAHAAKALDECFHIIGNSKAQRFTKDVEKGRVTLPLSSMLVGADSEEYQEKDLSSHFSVVRLRADRAGKRDMGPGL